jgi:hypothetical protein
MLPPAVLDPVPARRQQGAGVPDGSVLASATRACAPARERNCNQPEQYLEEQLTRGPHRRRASEPRQQVLRDDQLHLEQQEGGEKNGEAEKQAMHLLERFEELAGFAGLGEARRLQRLLEGATSLGALAEVGVDHAQMVLDLRG